MRYQQELTSRQMLFSYFCQWPMFICFYTKTIESRSDVSIGVVYADLVRKKNSLDDGESQSRQTRSMAADTGINIVWVLIVLVLMYSASKILQVGLLDLFCFNKGISSGDCLIVETFIGTERGDSIRKPVNSDYFQLDRIRFYLNEKCCKLRNYFCLK